MTLQELEAKQAMDLNTTSWLREIAIQLAMLNQASERKPKAK